jgi:hypothetical protein
MGSILTRPPAQPGTRILSGPEGIGGKMEAFA